MTNNITPEVTPAPARPARTAAANAARMRKSEGRWADHLRGRGYAVVPRASLEAMLRQVADSRASTGDEWFRGFREGLLSVATVSDELRGR